MIIAPWVAATLAAALIQTVRFRVAEIAARARGSRPAAPPSRGFVFAAPLAAALAAGLIAASGVAAPAMGAGFWGMVVLGGGAQILATLATVALFSHRNFAVGIAFTKTETLLVARLLGADPRRGGEPGRARWPSSSAPAGVLLLSMPVRGGPARCSTAPRRSASLAGAFFGLSAIGYRARDPGAAAGATRCCARR